MDFLGLGILALLALVFGWLVTRAWRIKNGLLKWAGTVVTGLLTLVCVLVLGLALYGYYRLYAPRGNPVVDVKVAGTPEQVKRGEQIASICAGCHGQQAGKPPLTGRNFMEAEPGSAGGPPPVGTFYSANLTPAGEIKDWSDGELIRAIREGVHKSGRSLLIMPSVIFHNMSDEDVHALVAYLRSMPAAGTPHPQPQFNVLGGVLLATVFGEALSAQPPLSGPVKAPPKGATKEYGEYLVSFAGCRDCHGKDLAGGNTGGPGGPDSGVPTPNLTLVVPQWNESDFVKLFRTGTLPDGKAVGQEMPWQEYNAFSSDDDLKAIFAYLKQLPPIKK